MTKRILDLSASDVRAMKKEDILASIRAAEGRTIVSEVISVVQPILLDISNAELASSFGADIILLNMYDAEEPLVEGLPHPRDNPLEELKKLTGRIIGVNLEPVDKEEKTSEEKIKISPGRLGTLKNIEKIVNQGADMVVFTGNPKTGVTNSEIINSIKTSKESFGDRLVIMAGKMHSSGSLNEIGSNLIGTDTIRSFILAGADIILLPAPGTVPGMTTEYVRELVEYVHSKGRLTMTSIGTSQEGSDESTIKSIALYSKMAGTDMHHLGDSGMTTGIANPENIMIYSIAVKGKRHTYRRMARSVNR
nr:haloacid dehalogenase-like hydrolase [Tissierella sp.]